MKKTFALVLMWIIIFITSCSLLTEKSYILFQNENKTIYSAECSNNLEIILLNNKEEKKIWVDFIKSHEYQDIKKQLKINGFIAIQNELVIQKYYCSIFHDTIISINVPFKKPNNEREKLEFVKLYFKNKLQNIYAILISKVNNYKTIIEDSAFVYITISESGPITPEQEFPKYSVFNTISNQFYFSIFSFSDYGTITIKPSTISGDRFLICFSNCYDPCAYYCYDDELDPSKCLSNCWVYCRNKCIIANWWQ